MKSFLHILQEKIVVFDGATGTHLQGQNLSADDFGGEELNGCNEVLVVSKPSAVERMHADYLNAGCDVIETNSFGGTSIVLAEYGLEKKAYELNFKAAQLAKAVASNFSSAGHPRFVAGSMGPTTKLPSLGHISFTAMAESYYEQAKGLVEGGADLLSVETCQDVLQIKAALSGIFRYFKEARRRVPVVVSVTVESVGTMLLGTEISAALAAIEPFDVDLIGMNCATGPKEMSEHVRVLCASSPKPVFVMPNAGIPENIGGSAHYHLSPQELVRYLSHFVRDLGVQVVGGCCGTTPEHIRQLVQEVGSCAPATRNIEFTPSASSLYQAVPFRIDQPPVLVGERTNANGSKMFRDLLAKEDWEGIVAMGREQVKEQAHMQDVCVAFVGRDELRDMHEVISRFNTQVSSPLMIDSTEPPAIEKALQLIGGKPVVNSINLEDGEGRAAQVLSLCKAYGAAVIALTIDEEGMAKTAERKLAIAKRIHNLAVNSYGMKPHDVIFDPLTFTLGSGDEEFRKAGKETLDAIRLIKRHLPQAHTLLGVSNISFGLAPAIRQVLNSVFLHHAVEAGLDIAIVHASKIMPLYRIDEKARELCRQLIFDERRYEGIGEHRKTLYDPLTELLTASAGMSTVARKRDGAADGSVEERLKNRIIDGSRPGLQADLDEAMKRYAPLDIVNSVLLDGMRVVGELFGAGQMQLPFVLQSAEVMKAAVSYLENFMEKKEGSRKGTMVIATVKGDVHDIGKNLVDIILSNNGYKVVNLGIKCSIETMLQAVEEQKADALGMSGLLVKSTLVMKENLGVMNERSLTLPVILGGAALTRRYVENDLRAVYAGPVLYANDAFDGLKYMSAIVSGTLPQTAGGDANAVTSDSDVLTGAEAKIALAEADAQSARQSDRPLSGPPAVGRTSVSPADRIPVPPFWGSRIVEAVDLDEVYRYINEVALIRGQWRVVAGSMSQRDYQALLESKVYPELARIKQAAKSEKLLEPKVAYGHFPCQSEGNDLVVYDPESYTRPGLNEGDRRNELVRFSFPRQSHSPYLCISDFFSHVGSGIVDVVSFHLVTMGRTASVHSKKLFDGDNYKEYLYFHGLSVECAEALAELWHQRIRQELGIAGKDSPEIRKLFAQGYQGSRYSFGYPACPNLEDQTKLFALLRPERIGVNLTEEFQLEPEQSTSAIVVHHVQARYFNVR